MHTDLKRSWREMLTEVQLSFLEFTHWGFEEDLGMRVSEILPSFFEVLDIAKRLKNRLPDHQGLHEIKGDKVKAYALEKYNPLNLFVGHAQVSNCCIYPGSQGISCGQNAFTTSVSRRSKIDYEVHTSLMLVAYNPAVEQFVGSNWAWVPSYVNVPFPTGDGDEVEEIDSVLAQMIVLDQFELSVWASGSNYGERVDVDASISDFMTLAPRMFEDNPFGYILAGISGYTEEIVKQVYLHTFKDLRFVWGRNLKTGLPLVTNINQDILETLLTHTAVTYDWENNIYSDIELTDFTTDVKPLAYPPKQNLEHAYESPDTPYYACVVCGEELRDPDSVNDWEALALNSDNSMHYDVDDRDKGMKFVHIGCVFECDNCQNTLPQGMLNKEIERATEDYVCNNCVEECVQCGSTFVKGESARGMLVETVNNDDACTVCAVPCDSCEGYMWDEDSITVGTNETHPSEICVLCDEDRPACAECGTKDYSLYTELTDIEGSKYCEDCIKSCESCNNTRPKSEKTCGDCGEDF